MRPPDAATKAVRLYGEELQRSDVDVAKYLTGNKCEFWRGLPPASRERVRKKLGLEIVSIPRYHWRLSSDGFVDGDDIYDHFKWIFGLIQPGRPLFQQLGQDFQYGMSVFWSGNGTGGGPLLTLEVAELLVFHRMDIGVCFYLDEA